VVIIQFHAPVTLHPRKQWEAERAAKIRSGCCTRQIS